MTKKDNSEVLKKVEEIRNFNSRIKRITVVSTKSNVKLVTGINKEETSVELTGFINEEENYNFYVKAEEDSIDIIVEDANISNSMDIIIVVPARFYEKITIDTKKGYIFIDKDSNIKKAIVTSDTGDIVIGGNFKRLIATNLSGDVSIQISAMQNVMAEVSTVSGNIVISTENIGIVNLNTNAWINFNSINSRQGSYSATFNLKTSSGKIEIE